MDTISIFDKDYPNILWNKPGIAITVNGKTIPDTAHVCVGTDHVIITDVPIVGYNWVTDRVQVQRNGLWITQAEFQERVDPAAQIIPKDASTVKAIVTIDLTGSRGFGIEQARSEIQLYAQI